MLCISCLCLSLVRNNFIQAGPLLPLLNILLVRMDTILELGGDPWESTYSPAPFFSPGLYPVGFFQAHLWTRVVILLSASAAKVVPDIQIPDRLFLVSKYEVWQGIFACWLLDFLCWDVVTNALQKISWIVCATQYRPFSRSQSLKIWSLFQLSEGLRLCNLSHHLPIRP